MTQREGPALILNALGAVASGLLLFFFLAPPLLDLTGGQCDLAAVCPLAVESGVVSVLAVMVVFCMAAGLAVRRLAERTWGDGGLVAAACVGGLVMFGGFLHIVSTAAFY